MGDAMVTSILAEPELTETRNFRHSRSMEALIAPHAAQCAKEGRVHYERTEDVPVESPHNVIPPHSVSQAGPDGGPPFEGADQSNVTGPRNKKKKKNAADTLQQSSCSECYQSYKESGI